MALSSALLPFCNRETWEHHVKRPTVRPQQSSRLFMPLAASTSPTVTSCHSHYYSHRHSHTHLMSTSRAHALDGTLTHTLTRCHSSILCRPQDCRSYLLQCPSEEAALQFQAAVEEWKATAAAAGPRTGTGLPTVIRSPSDGVSVTENLQAL